jgi:hypothetical protein
MYNTFTNTGTYTVTDIRKTFEGFNADFRMIAARTGKKTISEVDALVNDIMIWAEMKYLDYIDIALLNSTKQPVKAVRYRVDENGKANQSDRAGNNNDWQNIYNSELRIVVNFNSKWENLTKEQQYNFMAANNFKCSWGNLDFDNSYYHLTKHEAQLYASKGYELKKENYK